MGNLTRRRFLQNSALTGGALAISRRVRASGTPATPARQTQLSPVGYEQVKLLDGPLREQFDRNHAFFLALSEDSLLKPFRQKAGLPAPGEDMGGWY
ncbi:MAG: twin-arginine translocation signal domain-containing protein, partial [Acidobacteriaceae bacterium]